VIPEEQVRIFHHTVAQLLFLSGRARPDIKTAVAFLTTRVKEPDEDDWGKLKRVLKYLKGTRHMKLRLTVDNMHTLRWWVDASYGVHWDCKGHTGMMMSLGKGAVMSFSHRQKLNARSSTEAELIGIDGALPYIMWRLYFIEAQGYEVVSNILLQDNQSTILLAKNGRWSSSKRTKHINNRYFLVKDKIARGEIDLQYAPTTEMWSDVLTKPLQGRMWCVMRSNLMNVPVDYDDEAERKDTHPDLLPKADENPVTEGDARVLKKALALIAQGQLEVQPAPTGDSRILRKRAVLLYALGTMTRRTGQPAGHRRSVLGNGRVSAVEARAAAPTKCQSLVGERSEHNRTVVVGAGEKVSGKIPSSQKILLALLCLRARRHKAG